MTALNGLIGIDFNLAAIVVSTSLSSQRAVLIHQFDDRPGVVQPPTLTVPISIKTKTAPRPRRFSALLAARHRVIKPGAACVCDVSLMSIDFYPTLLEVAGVRDAAGRCCAGPAG
jgi:hypothetical protein